MAGREKPIEPLDLEGARPLNREWSEMSGLTTRTMCGRNDWFWASKGNYIDIRPNLDWDARERDRSVFLETAVGNTDEIDDKPMSKGDFDSELEKRQKEYYDLSEIQYLQGKASREPGLEPYWHPVIHCSDALKREEPLSNLEMLSLYEERRDANRFEDSKKLQLSTKE